MSGGDLDPAEARLAERAARGDRAALRELYLLHREAAQRVAFRYLGDEAEARDVVQDVFVTLLTQPAAFAPTARFSTWLWRVVANRCLNRRAKAGFRGGARDAVRRRSTCSRRIRRVPPRRPC